MNNYRILPKNGNVFYLYAESKEELQKAFPDAQIEVYTDMEYMKLVNELKSKAIMVNEENDVYVMKSLTKDILFRFMKYNGQTLDGIEYKVVDKSNGVKAENLKSISRVREFYDKYFDVDRYKRGYELLSRKEFKRIKTRNFYRKNKISLYKDRNDVIYYLCNEIKPGIKYKTAYEKFGNKAGVVLVKYFLYTEYDQKKGNSPYNNLKIDYFPSIEKFKAFFFSQKKKHIPSCGEARYRIIKEFPNGLKAPDEIRCYIQFPYYDFRKEYELRKPMINKDVIVNSMANEWVSLFDFNGIDKEESKIEAKKIIKVVLHEYINKNKFFFT